MKVTLDTDEIMDAIISYMALKGYILKDDYMDFKWNNKVRNGNLSVAIKVRPAQTNLEGIKKFANR